MNVYLVIFTDQLGGIVGKTFLSLNTDFEAAKQFAQDYALSHFEEWHVAEIDGIWCIEGRVVASHSMGYIALYRMVKGD